MKASELQIGDYVNYRGQNIKVTSLYDKGGSNEVGWSEKESVWVNADNVEPIPLTLEILEKNGWSQEVYSNVSYDNEDIEYLSLWVGEDGKNAWWWHVGCELVIPINYVHEFQQALRLCGTEKEIEL